VVPVPAVPEVLLSSEIAFDQLDNATTPSFFRLDQLPDECPADWRVDSVPLGTPTNDSVTVFSRERVGPYATVVLTGAEAADVTSWLVAEGFSLPAGLDALLAPYLTPGGAFVALKLAPGMTTGDLAPIAFRYPGDAPQIPIQLTAVAAARDMPIEVTLVGPGRAVPISYLHLEINLAAIDWDTGGANYADVVRAAALEAGGHGFATDISLPAAPFAGNLPTFGPFDTQSVAVDAGSWLAQMANAGVYGDAFATVIGQFIDLGDIDAFDVANCAACYVEEFSGPPIDAAAATSAVLETVVAPLENVRAALVAGDRLTRMTSSMSPEDMTLDPTFAFNASLPEEDGVHRINALLPCPQATRSQGRLYALGDGRTVKLPPVSWLIGNGVSSADFLAAWRLRGAHRIEQAAPQGPSVVLFDGAVEPDANLVAMKAWVDAMFPMPDEVVYGADTGCALATGAPRTLWGLASLALVGRYRRRSAACCSVASAARASGFRP
jgi:hypothetical protein